jgi:hypothetical protein
MSDTISARGKPTREIMRKAPMKMKKRMKPSDHLAPGYVAVIEFGTPIAWLNRIGIWFSILVRKLLRRGNFTSKEHLQQRIESCIATFNATMAKPFRWTKGKPLVA